MILCVYICFIVVVVIIDVVVVVFDVVVIIFIVTIVIAEQFYAPRIDWWLSYYVVKVLHTHKWWANAASSSYSSYLILFESWHEQLYKKSPLRKLDYILRGD